MTTEFIVIETNDKEATIASAIKNYFEQQLDCDYFEEFNSERDGGEPIRYQVTVKVKRLGRL